MLSNKLFKDDFPIFAHTPHTYLDSAATTHKPQAVIDAISTFYSKHYGTVRRGIYQLSQGATERFESCRKAIANLIHAEHPEEIIFTSGATEGTNIVAHSFLMPRLQPGDEIVISVQEHHANYVPWQQVAQRTGATLSIARLDDHGCVDLDHVRQLVNDRTRFLAFSHVSNVVGNSNPVQALTEIAHQVGAKILIDAAQSVGHQPIDVEAIKCDFLVFSGHKIYGPTGTGILYARKKLLDTMPPYRFGGEMIRQVHETGTTFREGPQKFEAGTPNVGGIIGLHEAVKYVEEIGLENIALHEKKLMKHMVQGLQNINVAIVGAHQTHSSLVSFIVDNIHPHDVASVLDQDKIAVRAGHHCAQPLHRYLKIPASVRVSLGIYNDQEDIARLMDGIQKVRKLMR